MHGSIPLEQVSVEDKLQDIEEIWTHLAGTPENIASPYGHTDVLRGREERISEGDITFSGYSRSQKSCEGSTQMRVQVLDEATADLPDEFRFCEQQAEGLGDYLLDSLRSDIQSLCIYGGIHAIYNGYWAA